LFPPLFYHGGHDAPGGRRLAYLSPFNASQLNSHRAVLFAQLVDDPSAYADTLLNASKVRARAGADLAVRLELWRNRETYAHDNAPDMPKPTLVAVRPQTPDLWPTISGGRPHLVGGRRRRTVARAGENGVRLTVR